MPPIALNSRRARGLGLAVVCLAFLTSFATPALASQSCPSTTTAKVFKSFGDTADYSLLSNGAFESGTSGWSLTRAAVAAGNEPWKVRSSADTKSLAMQSSGLVVSPAFCVGSEHPSFRFFARRTSGNWGVLYVNLRWTDGGGEHTINVGALSGDGYTSWKATPSLPLATTLPLTATSTLSVRLVLDAEDSGGAWAIDDVYIDPYRR